MENQSPRFFECGQCHFMSIKYIPRYNKRLRCSRCGNMLKELSGKEYQTKIDIIHREKNRRSPINKAILNNRNKNIYNNINPENNRINYMNNNNINKNINFNKKRSINEIYNNKNNKLNQKKLLQNNKYNNINKANNNIDFENNLYEISNKNNNNILMNNSDNLQKLNYDYDRGTDDNIIFRKSNKLNNLNNAYSLRNQNNNMNNINLINNNNNIGLDDNMGDYYNMPNNYDELYNYNPSIQNHYNSLSKNKYLNQNKNFYRKENLSPTIYRNNNSISLNNYNNNQFNNKNKKSSNISSNDFWQKIDNRKAQHHKNSSNNFISHNQHPSSHTNYNNANNISNISKEDPMNQVLDNFFGDFFNDDAPIQVSHSSNRRNMILEDDSSEMEPHLFFHSFFSPFGIMDGVFRQNYSSNFGSLRDLVRLLELAQRGRGNAHPPATKDALNKLKRFPLAERFCKKKNGKIELPNCCICQSEIELGSKTVLLPCGHMYHWECCLQWLKTNNTCPICRFEIK